MRRLAPRTPNPGGATKPHGKTLYQARHAVVPCVAGRSDSTQRRGPVGLAVAVSCAAVVTTMVIAPAGSSSIGASTRTVHPKQSIIRSHDVATKNNVDLVAPVAAGGASRRTGSDHTTLDAHTTREPVTGSDVTTSSASVSPLASDGIPVTALQAYRSAAKAMAVSDPNCQIPWPLVAGIGRVESDHGRFGGAVLRTDGTSTVKILGPVLDGHGTAVITDTDGGSLDGDTMYDRAMGPMQFIPSTWNQYASDGNGDGVDDPFNVFDAALATAKYLCAAGGNLSTNAGQERAVFSYNHLDSYVREVIGLERAYAAGAGVAVPNGPVGTGSLPSSGTSATGGAAAPVRVHKPRHTKRTPVAKTPLTAPAPSTTSGSKTSGHGSSKGSGKGGSDGGKAGTPPSTPPSTTPPSTTPPSTTPPSATPPSTTPPSTSPPTTGSTSTGTSLTCPAGSHPAGSKPGPTNASNAAVPQSAATSAALAAPAATSGTATAAKAPKLPAGCVPDTDPTGSTGTLAG